MRISRTRLSSWRPVLALLFLASVASACASSPPEAVETPEHLLAPQYRVLPSVPATEPVAEAQPAVPTGNRQLDAFLAELAAALDRHDWRGVAARFDPAQYAEQWALVTGDGANDGAAAVQVLAETLGMQGLLQPIGTFEADPVSRLERIQVVTFREVEPRRMGTAQIRGDVRLDDGSRLPLQFSIQPMSDTYAVVVPM
ncbi:MAG: hypothetical protein AAF170_19520, partial [Bacteroidota bacterium]